MNAAASSIESLHAELLALQDALDRDEHALAAQMVADHDRHLRQYIAQAGRNASIAGMASLLELQQRLMARMREARDEAGAWLRASRQSNNAARAYSQAGSLR